MRERARARSRGARPPGATGNAAARFALGDAAVRADRACRTPGRARPPAAHDQRTRHHARPARSAPGRSTYSSRCLIVRTRACACARDVSQQPRAERVGRLDVDDERHRGDRQVAEVAGRRAAPRPSRSSARSSTPAAFAAAAIRATSRAREAVVIAERASCRRLSQPADEDVGEEPLGPRDAARRRTRASCSGTTTVSRAPRPCRGAPSVRVTRNTGGDAERAADALGGGVGSPPSTSAASRGRAAVERLAQAAGRQRPIAEVVFAVTSSRSTSRASCKMLKPVVEQVDGGAELRFGEAARQIPIGADQHRRRRAARARASAARRRLSSSPASTRVPSETTVTPSARDAPSVAARQDRRPLAAARPAAARCTRRSASCRCRRRGGCRR